MVALVDNTNRQQQQLGEGIDTSQRLSLAPCPPDAEHPRGESEASQTWEQRTTTTTTGRYTTRDTNHTHGSTMHTARDTHGSALTRDTTDTANSVRSQSPIPNRYRGFSVAEEFRKIEENIYGDVFSTTEVTEGKIKDAEVTEGGGGGGGGGSGGEIVNKFARLISTQQLTNPTPRKFFHFINKHLNQPANILTHCHFTGQVLQERQRRDGPHGIHEP